MVASASRSFSASSRAAKISEIEGASASAIGGVRVKYGTVSMPRMARIDCTTQMAAIAPKSANQKLCKKDSPQSGRSSCKTCYHRELDRIAGVGARRVLVRANLSIIHLPLVEF